MSRTKVAFSILCVGLLVTVLVISCGGGEEPTQAPTPPPSEITPTEVAEPSPPPMMSGAELLRERCVVCHSLDRVEAASKTQSEWEATVERMRGKGAELTDDEAQALIEYLAENYGP